MGLNWTEQELRNAKTRMRRGEASKEPGSAYSPRGTRRPESTGGAAPSSPFDSAWEAEYARHLDLQKIAGTIKAYWYHPSTFHLPGKVKYTPDFLVQYPDGLERRLQYVELKGWSKNRRDGVTRYKIAAGLFECFEWIMVERAGKGWQQIG